MSLPTVKRVFYLIHQLCISIVLNTIFIRLPGSYENDNHRYDLEYQKVGLQPPFLRVATSQYNTLSATVPIDASPVCIEQLDVVLLPHTQHHGVLGVAQLQDSHLHVGNGVTRLSIQYFRYYSIQW